MVCGVGIDVVEVERIGRIRLRWGERFLRRVFTKDELDGCLHSALRDQRLAARFAAKEAFLKALGTGLALGARWLEIAVSSDERGAPSLRFSGAVTELVSSRGIRSSHLSLSHTANVAVAVVVLER